MFSQIKDIKHIERDFHSATWFMPQGKTLVLGFKNLFFPNMVMHIKLKELVGRIGYK